MQTQERIFNLTELGSVALGLLSRMKEYRVIAFSGELGSGKTTLISNICNLVGVEDAGGFCLYVGEKLNVNCEAGAYD